MTPDVVVDVGNTRIKWARCSANPGVFHGFTSLPPDDEAAWQRQVDVWRLPSPAKWVVAGVHPPRRDRLVDWLRQRGDDVRVIDSPGQLPLRVLLDEPHKVGIDRLLTAVGVNQQRSWMGRVPGFPDQGLPTVIITAGTAVTVDLLDESGAFRGGAILPGFRLMAQALHQHTALLPLIDPVKAPLIPELPGTSTSTAMKAGIFWAVGGGARALVEQYARAVGQRLNVWFTGGDYRWIADTVADLACVVDATSNPGLTLLGIRLTAESLP